MEKFFGLTKELVSNFQQTNSTTTKQPNPQTTDIQTNKQLKLNYNKIKQVQAFKFVSTSIKKQNTP